MLNAILWDNDGVLVDTEGLFYEVNRKFFRAFAIELTQEDFYKWFLCSDAGIWHRLRDRGYAEIEIDEARKRRNADYTAQLLSSAPLERPGIPELVRSLYGRVKMGVVTGASREHFDAIHRVSAMRHCFDLVLTAEQYKAAKPSPEPYLTALARLGLQPAECVVVEDSPRGLQAATAAGLRCVVLRTPLTGKHLFAEAFAVVDSIQELAVQLDRMLESKP
jgi:HAD superfamily hydrolase (TIGR01509 family)